MIISFMIPTFLMLKRIKIAMYLHLHAGVELPAEPWMTFNTSMSEDDFFKWLKRRGVSDKDCNTLSGKIS